ncbi:MAG: hypothetical protein LBF77_00810 [Spirochaetaceae bacterium]|jgi:hypothetical protein|nr:hypothetical protein [Spirochaetaceae bacterium]
MFGIGSRDKLQGPEQFWQDYSARYGETIRAYGLARYISGWAEFREALWGLLIATSGGCRVHHFPHEGWIQALSRASIGGDAPQEKTLFIPHEKILGVELRIEKSWWKKFLNPTLPHILIHYCLEGVDGGRDSVGNTLVIEADQNAAKIVRHLQQFCSTGEPECG